MKTERTMYTEGTKVRIDRTNEVHASHNVGKTGRVTARMCGAGMVSIDLDDGTFDVWAHTYNITRMEG